MPNGKSGKFKVSTCSPTKAKNRDAAQRLQNPQLILHQVVKLMPAPPRPAFARPLSPRNAKSGGVTWPEEAAVCTLLHHSVRCHGGGKHGCPMCWGPQPLPCQRPHFCLPSDCSQNLSFLSPCQYRVQAARVGAGGSTVSGCF